METHAYKSDLIETIYVEYREKLIAYFHKRINDFEVSQDLTQEVFLKIISKQIMINQETVSYLLFTVAHNIMIDHLRRKNRFSVNSIDDYTISQYETCLADSLLEYKELKKEYDKCVSLLPDTTKKVYLLTDKEEYKIGRA